MVHRSTKHHVCFSGRTEQLSHLLLVRFVRGCVWWLLLPDKSRTGGGENRRGKRRKGGRPQFCFAALLRGIEGERTRAGRPALPPSGGPPPFCSKAGRGGVRGVCLNVCVMFWGCVMRLMTSPVCRDVEYRVRAGGSLPYRLPCKRDLCLFWEKRKGCSGL